MHSLGRGTQRILRRSKQTKKMSAAKRHGLAVKLKDARKIGVTKFIQGRLHGNT